MNGMFITQQDEVLARYIHNAYIGSWLKLGFLGPIVIIFMIVGVFGRALRYGRGTKDIKFKALFLTIAAAFLVPVMTSVTQPEWLSQAGIAFFASMIGLQIISHRVMVAKHGEDAPAEKAPAAKAPICYSHRA